MRVLVVDDSKPIRSILAKMLRAMDFEVTQAANGQEALDALAATGRPDLVTVNWNMPVLDGLTFIRSVRANAHFANLPLLMISVESDPDKVNTALRAGASGYVVKPFTVDQLTDQLQQLGVLPQQRSAADTHRQAARHRPRLRVLIVDDSVVIRHTVSQVLADDPELEVIGTAADGRIALEKVRQTTPDVLLLDIEMPNMNGFETLKALRQTHPRLPVIMFSVLTERGAAATLDALLLGANDYVPKPTNVQDYATARQCIRAELIPKIKQFAAHVMPGTTHPEQPGLAPPPAARQSRRHRIEIVVIGVSTGGPAALARLLPDFAEDCPVPVVIVQHMPPVFTQHLAERLARGGRLDVQEGNQQQQLRGRLIRIAPGGYHAVVARRGRDLWLELNQAPPENSCRPSADVLFRSAAAACGSGALGIVLTGMGRDGLRGCEQIVAAGGQVLAQDEATSVVWGMPGHVARAGLADEVLPLDQLGAAITERVRYGRGQGRCQS